MRFEAFQLVVGLAPPCARELAAYAEGDGGVEAVSQFAALGPEAEEAALQGVPVDGDAGHPGAGGQRGLVQQVPQLGAASREDLPLEGVEGDGWRRVGRHEEEVAQRREGRVRSFEGGQGRDEPGEELQVEPIEEAHDR